MSTTCRIAGFEAGAGLPLVLIAGPCVIESPEISFTVARTMQALCAERGVHYVFKASFDKANRTAISGERGPGLAAGLDVLRQIKADLNVPITTDVHESDQCEPVAAVADILQIPAFLCRQTDLLVAAGQAAARHGRAVNIKKGQFLAPEGMRHAADKVRSAGCTDVLLTERGTTFGYNNLVVDFRGLEIMAGFAPVCMDATHAVQHPGGGGDRSGGDRRFVPTLVRAAMAVGVDALFLETHPDPLCAPSDGPNMIPLAEMPALLEAALAIRAARG